MAINRTTSEGAQNVHFVVTANNALKLMKCFCSRGIYPRENKFVVALSLGEGWHNYHHTFPWDYRASEFGGSWCWMNLSANIIEFFVKMGWAWDLKVATPALVDARMKRTGAAQ